MKIKQFISNSKKNHIDKTINLYDSYLKNQRGLTFLYISFCCDIARHFLNFLSSQALINIKKITPENITNYIFYFAKQKSSIQTQRMTTALRSFLRFLEFQYKLKVKLSNVVLSVAFHKQAAIPEYLKEKEINKALKHCDKNSKTGLRDYTIVKLAFQLGLRSCEIMNLTLDDFDWENGEIIIKGKGARISRLPISQELGQDLVNYLQNGRPSSYCRNFFLGYSRPYKGLSYRVGNIISSVLKKAKINFKRGGTRLLRHSLATCLLQKRATLQEIKEVLRHKSINTTAIYAKVDFKRLKSLALPWPIKGYNGGDL